jgi:phenylalanyl-tRNA synthetase beta chain
MRVPLTWLHEYCAPDLDSFALAERLAMTGTEVERVETHGVSGLEHFVIGKVMEARRHPDADRLSICQVDTGDGGASQIVCGAPNVATGQTVAVGKPGSVMPDGTVLKTAKLRGEPSHGMILAEDELSIGSDHEGIMVLDDALAPAMSIVPGATVAPHTSTINRVASTWASSADSGSRPFSLRPEASLRRPSASEVR